MTRDEYLKDRDLHTDKDRQYYVYRHVCFRLRERFGITHKHWSLRDWIDMSFACLTRKLDVIRRDNQAVFCVSEYAGERVVWVYSRTLKMIVTVLRADEVENNFKYMEALRLAR